MTKNDYELSAKIRALVNYGYEKKYIFDFQGTNSRIDEVQAALLGIKLKYLDQDNQKRREIARRYFHEIKNPLIALPGYSSGEDNVFHIFPIFSERRDELQKYLKENGVETLIHYPVPPHKQACYPHWNKLSYPITEKIHSQELSLPISPVMTQSEVSTVIELLNSWK